MILESGALNGGRMVAQRLKAHGVRKLFTLSGGHLFSVYDGCKHEGVDLIDVRHEQTAAFAAEGWAKVTREPGVAALTAGPGVTNGMSAMASAQQNRSPMLVIGGRAPDFRWGQGSLQEIDHVPFVRPLVKYAGTPGSTVEVPGMIDEALLSAATPHTGPTFVDLPLDHVFANHEGEWEPEAPRAPKLEEADAAELDRAVARLREAERPVIMAGTNLYWGRAEAELVALAEACGIPVFLNGLGRGCVPADHDLAFSRARSTGLKGADVALVIGVPMDFRLGFGASFGEETEIIVARRRRAHSRAPEGSGGRALRRSARHSHRPARRRRRLRRGHLRLGLRAARGGGRASSPRSRPSSPTSARRCTRCACSPACGR